MVDLVWRSFTVTHQNHHSITPHKLTSKELPMPWVSSILRLNHFNKSFVSPNTPQSPLTSALGEYLMRYSIGTPPVEVYGILDTGSDITWLQCRPCQNCFKQSTPIFDPSKSKTYKTISCTSDICGSTLGTSCEAPTRSCKYFIHYSGGAQSQGDLSLETLTLGSTNGSLVKIPRIMF